jgi:ParB-like chromosome segregation protein Spo0J
MDVFALPVHPAADVFPMMSDDELAELAEDIKENGLREPLVIADIVDANGVVETMLVDGRNRSAACRVAGVVPPVKKLNGEDPTAYILSANIHRRHMTKGQRAMAVAMIYPEAERGGRGQKAASSGRFTDIAHQRISQARAVIQWARDLADGVLDGTVSLDAAYKEASDRKKAKEWRNLDVVKLRDRAPDLAQRVVDEEISISEAKTLLAARDEEQRNIRQSVFMALSSVRDIASFAHGNMHRELPKWLQVDEYVEEFKRHFPGGIEELRKYTTDLKSAIDEITAVVNSFPKKGARK